MTALRSWHGSLQGTAGPPGRRPDHRGDRTLEPTQLGDGDVTIRVAYSSVSYLDALALTPGVAASSRYQWCRASTSPAKVIESSSPEFRRRRQVLFTRLRIGTGRHGGYGEGARLPADQVVALGALTRPRGAAIGTAEFTAAMSVEALVGTASGPRTGVLVTSATGGVGSVSVDLSPPPLQVVLHPA